MLSRNVAGRPGQCVGPSWQLAPRDREAERALASALGVHPVTAAVLRRRGLETEEAARRFLSPSLDQLHDPLLLPDMLPAARRVQQALLDREPLLVHGDYDADGLTAAALLVRFLSRLGGQIRYFVPHRMRDHYGLSVRAVEQAADAGVKLLIAADCGLRDEAAVTRAQARGMDVVVLDHHEPGSALPAGAWLVAPRRPGCEYPEQCHLASVGLAFKLACAVARLYDLEERFVQRAFLDLVAIGTVADVAPLLGENRALVRAGLDLLQTTQKVGLQRLMGAAGVEGAVTTDQVAFRLAPRLNAAGRLDDATEALELLITEDQLVATRIALRLDSVNRERQERQAVMAAQAAEMLAADERAAERPVFVLASPEWHVGVVGIVAAHLVERHGRPVVLLAQADGMLRGSGRSIPQLHLAQALEACGDLLEGHGGHAMAAGLALQPHNLAAFEERINEHAAQVLGGVDLQPRLMVDGEVELQEVDWRLAEELALLEPYGEGNPEAALVCRGAEVLQSDVVGRQGQHLKLFVTDGQRTHECIGFGQGGMLAAVRRATHVDLAFTPRINEFNDTRSLELRLLGVTPGVVSG